MEGFIPLLLLVVVFWFLILLPNRRRAQAASRLQSSLAVGQQVMTQSGLIGTIVSLTDDQVSLQIAPGVTTEWVRPAIVTIMTAPEPKE
jgi:preprotein translocase subunit YajC